MADVKHLTPDMDDEVLTPGEVAKLFKVDPKTVTRWAQAGRIPWIENRRPWIRTPGGHLRFRVEQIRKILSGEIEMHYWGWKDDDTVQDAVRHARTDTPVG